MSRSRAALIAVLLASCNPASGETTTNVDLTPEQQECVDIYDCRVGCADLWPGGWQLSESETASYDSCMSDCYSGGGEGLSQGTSYVVGYSRWCGIGRDDGGRAYGPCDDGRALEICTQDIAENRWKESCYALFWCAADCGDACEICEGFHDGLVDDVDWTEAVDAEGRSCGASCTWADADAACEQAAEQ